MFSPRNPYNCTCNSRPLFSFIKNQYSKVEDLADVQMTCEEGETSLQKIEKLEDFCTTGLSVAAIGAIGGVIAFLILVCALLILWSLYR